MMDRCDKKCSDCKFYYLQDHGYSNWTVIETVVHCIKELHPFFPEEDSFTWNQKNHPYLDVAKECGGFKEGDHIHTDVDLEDMEHGSNDYSNYCQDEEQHQQLKDYKAGEVKPDKDILERNKDSFEKIKLMRSLE